MTTLPEIEKVILGLPPAECVRLSEWLSALMLASRRVAEPAAAYAGAMSFPMTFEEYLEFEEQSRVRHEYVAGEIFAMSGVTKRHNQIAGRLFLELGNHLRGGGCEPYMSGVKVKVQVNRDIHVYYPDVMVVCNPEPHEDRYVANPKLIVEVLSSSTAGIDRHEKRIAYREIPTLDEYVIVAQEIMEVTFFRREEGWTPTLLKSADEILELRSIDLRVPLATIYERVQLG